MARALLISANLAREPYPVYPLGMSLVAAAARARGHEVTEWDPLAEGAPLEAAAAVAARLQPDVIGLSLRNIDNTNAAGLVSFSGAWRGLVEALRGVSTAPIILGGAAYSLFPEALLVRLGADCGVAGEGERVFTGLLDALDRGEAPPAGVLRDSAPLFAHEFGAAPAPDAPLRDPRLAAFYLGAGGMLNLQAKRGCPHACAYCSYPALEGRRYRLREPGAVAEEIERLRRDAACDFYAFTDSVFNDREGEYLAIAEELVRRGLDIPWMAFFRPQRFAAGELALLRRAGLACIEWGTDGATDQTLAGLGKPFDWATVAAANRQCHEAGLAGSHFIIFGGPGETDETIQAGLANLERLEGCVVFAYAGIRILPGTPIRERALREGLLRVDDDLLDARFYLAPGLDRAALDQAIRRAFTGRTDRIYPPGGDEEKVAVFHRLGRRGPIWDLLLKARPPRR